VKSCRAELPFRRHEMLKTAVIKDLDMKKIITFLILILFTLPAFAKQAKQPPIWTDGNKPIECEVTVDWISKTQLQRDENIAQIQKALFNEKTVLKYPKKEFKAKYSEFSKDKDSMQHYMDISSGKKEDADKYYCGFSLKNGLLVAYGIQYKNNMKNVYYYDAMGHLKFVDVFSDSYPKLPYYTLQYNTSGKLIGTIYFVSIEDQYIFNPDKTFRGRWYKENMYNRNARIILTRSSY
jgi:hypothetical protein